MTHELLIRGGHVLTMDPGLGDLPVGDVHISGDRIMAIGPGLDVPDAEVIDATGKIVLPGLIDGHRHVWQSLLRGMASDWSFPEYMLNARALYGGCFDAGDAYLANYLGGLEAIEAGVTSVVDHSHLQSSPAVSEGLVRGLVDSGVGGVYCYALQNAPDHLSVSPVDSASVRDLFIRTPDSWHDQNAARLRDTYLGSGPLLFGVAMPETTAYLPPEHAAALFERARALKPALITSHWNAIKTPEFYISSLKQLVEARAFSAATLLSHINQFDESDLALMAKAGLGLCTCPDSECGMGLGPLMAKRFVELGGAASLGVDVSCMVQADVLKQARLLLQAERKRMADERGAVPREIGWTTRAVLDMLTLTGARSLGLEHEIGSLTPGKRADVIVVNPHPVLASPMTDPVATLIFYTDAADVETVLVAGVLRKHNGKLLNVDFDELRRDMDESTRLIRERFAKLPVEKLQDVWEGIF
jgi:5-methylthioadenosine/S-adenosylhomocysteine deaminase